VTETAPPAAAAAAAAAKAAARAAAAAARAAAHAGGQGEAATAHLLALLMAAPARVIAGYLPIRTEIDPRPAMAALAAAGRRVAVPVVLGEGRALGFREWHPGAALVEGAYGAPVPAAGDWLVPQALIVPLLAFDARGFRLGYGGGFYDRTLAALGPVLTVGLAYAGQEVAEVPVEPTDHPLDHVVTERGLRFSRAAGR
jgi:5-formyltetrahydrofolate cyclo-ligase